MPKPKRKPAAGRASPPGVKSTPVPDLNTTPPPDAKLTAEPDAKSTREPVEDKKRVEPCAPAESADVKGRGDAAREARSVKRLPPFVHIKPPRDSLLKKAERVAAFLSSVAVVAGVFFAVYQLKQSDAAERRRAAIEVVGRTRSAEFLRDYRALKDVYLRGHISEEEKKSLADPMNHVMNVYDSAAVMYINNLADRCIIRDSVYGGAREMSEISDGLTYPPEYKGNFDLFLSLMEKEQCGPPAALRP
jgi:hypothetical protein